jgi:hypothetical protein
MRAFPVCLWVIALVSSAASAADDGFPYEAYVAVDGAEVVSGPGHRYYATQHLSRGVKVEVYREEPSGWLAIRPPERAFSWVPAEAIERSEEDDSVGRATEPTPVWVGTTAEHVQEHREQVTLKSGEVVRILGEKQVPGDDEEDQTWLKIAPPAGEFRWIHLRDVSRQRPPPLARERPTPPTKRRIAADDEEEVEAEEPRRFVPSPGAIALRDLPAEEPIKATLNGSEIETAQFRSSNSESPGKGISPDGFVPRKRRGSEPLQPVPAPSQRLASRQTATFTRPREEPQKLASVPSLASAPSLAGAANAAATSTSQAIDDVAGQLERLDVELSLMLAEDKSRWNLAAVRAKVEELIERGSDPVCRGQARLLLDKIKQFEEAFDVDEVTPVTAAPADGAGAVVTGTAADPRYDGAGWLKPVVSRRGDKPVAPFALVDANGKPVCFVTPSPGMNLSQYLNKHVGVYGRRGYIESLKTAHVTTERVIDLGRQLR